MGRRHHTLNRLAGLWGLLACVYGCEKPPIEAPPAYAPSIPEIQPLVDPVPVVDLEDAKTVELTLGPTLRYDSCRDVLEPNGKPVAKLDFADDAWLITLLACDAEAYLIGKDGARYIAWSTPDMAAGHRDLRVGAWAANGDYLWSMSIDRSREGESFAANFRRSFIIDLGSKICAGSLFEGGTQAACVQAQDGELNWSGRMPFWAGMDPVGVDGHFIVADLSGLTQRYPFSGVEMKFRSLDGTGGRSALYLRDDSALYFSPPRTDQPRLVRYDFSTLEPVWRVTLPEDPTPGYGIVADALGIVVIRVGESLLALQADSGKALWRLEMGLDRPSLAASSKALYMLHRRNESPNQLLALEPLTGKVLWVAEVPAGTLNVYTDNDQVILRSVRAAQVVENLP